MKAISRLAIIGLAILTFTPLFSQEKEKIKRVQVTDVHLTGGFILATRPTWNTQDFINLAPNSPFANEDLTGFSKNDFSMYSYNNRGTSKQLSAMIGLSFKKRDGSTPSGSPLLRLGVTYRYENLLSGSMYRQDQFAYDTLISSSTGSSYYLDSIRTYRYNMNHFVQQLHIDASLVYRTNTNRRASIYGGVGFTAGMGVNPTTEIIGQESAYTEIQNSSSGFQQTSYSNTEVYRVRNKSAFGGSLYLPLGVDLKFSTKNEFWKRVHWTFELRPAVNFFASPEVGVLTSFSSYQGMGLKINLR